MTQTQDSWEGYEEVGGAKLVKWDPGQVVTVEGIFQGSVEVNGQYGKQQRYTLVQDDGTPVEFFAPAILRRMLSDPRVKIGTRVKIESTGKTEKTTSGRMAKTFKVAVKG